MDARPDVHHLELQLGDTPQRRRPWLPLFWRVDLEIVASSVAHVAGYDQDNPAARGDDWSRPTSALANAVAATKAVLRGQPQTARGLLERGFRRIDAQDRVTGQWFADIRRLAEAAADTEPGLRPLAGRVVRLVRNHLVGSGEEAPRRRDGRRPGEGPGR
ncbi:hypothetical protein [Streptomyces sp. NBC_01240]|uniref:hypothetical protein n=1 Tax=Streptomyces sp. NBC_01240 TaxID=2903793 RepID=UPI002E0D4F7B|nr:hypothetical protein OG466_30120 [Streptomyces sp. NBC_01240]